VRGHPWIVLALSIGLAPAAAAQSIGGFEGTFQGLPNLPTTGAEFTGTMDVSAVVYRPGDIIQAQEMDGSWTTTRQEWRLVGPQAVGGGATIQTHEQGIRSVYSESRSGARFLLANHESSRVRLEGETVELNPVLGNQVLFPEKSEVRGTRTATHSEYWTTGARLVGRSANPVTVSGPVELYLWGVNLTGESENGATVALWSGRIDRADSNGLITHREEQVLHFVGIVDNLRIAAPPFLAIGVSSGWFEGLAGQVLIQGASGHVVVRGAEHDVNQANLRLVIQEGTLHIRGTATRGASLGSLRGDVSVVQVNGLDVPIPRPEGATAPGAGLVTVAAIVGGLLALARLGWLQAFFSRRTRVSDWAGYVDRTLQNPRRHQIYEVILARPGVQAVSVWAAVGGAFGVTLRALSRLERVGLVTSTKLGRFRHFFAKDNAAATSSISIAAAKAATRTGTQTLAALSRLGGAATLPALETELGLSAASVHERLQILVQAGLVARQRRGGRVVYESHRGVAPLMPAHQVPASPA
jgi:predicted transcriptional regulator